MLAASWRCSARICSRRRRRRRASTIPITERRARPLLGGPAAVAGYPHLTVPMGQVKGLPVGLSFIGPKWSDGMILSLGYAYEQASRKRADPRFYESIEESPEIAPHLRPAAR